MRVKLKLHRSGLGMADIGFHTSFQRIDDVARPNPRHAPDAEPRVLNKEVAAIPASWAFSGAGDACRSAVLGNDSECGTLYLSKVPRL